MVGAVFVSSSQKYYFSFDVPFTDMKSFDFSLLLWFDFCDDLSTVGIDPLRCIFAYGISKLKAGVGYLTGA